MSRACKLCHDPKRGLADRLIIGGGKHGTNRAVACRFKVSRQAVQRHRAHVGQALLAAHARKGEKAEDELLERAKQLWRAGWEVYQAARAFLPKKKGDQVTPEGLRAIGLAITGLREIIETQGHVTGRGLAPTVQIHQVNLLNVAPVIYQVLKRYPVALKAVEEALLADRG